MFHSNRATLLWIGVETKMRALKCVDCRVSSRIDRYQAEVAILSASRDNWIIKYAHNPEVAILSASRDNWIIKNAHNLHLGWSGKFVWYFWDPIGVQCKWKTFVMSQFTILAKAPWPTLVPYKLSEYIRLFHNDREWGYTPRSLRRALLLQCPQQRGNFITKGDPGGQLQPILILV
eukprot:sb/3471903/